MSSLILANEYTKIAVAEPTGKDGYAWVKAPKPKELARKEQLPQKDMEKLKEMWSKTDQAIQQQRYPDQESFKNVGKQLGKVINSSELVQIAQKMNPSLIVEDSKSVPECAAFYLMRPTGEKVYTNASFRKGFVTEFSIITTDTADLPTAIQYGWRTVLMRLMKFKAISYAQMLETFGEVHCNDARGKHWHMNVADFR